MSPAISVRGQQSHLAGRPVQEAAGAAAPWLQPCAWPRVAEAAAAEKASRTPPAHPPVTASDRHHPQGIMCCSALFSQILCKFGLIASTHNHRGKGACGK